MRDFRDRILLRSPETPLDPMKFLSYSWSASSLEPRPMAISSDSPEFDLDQLERSSLSSDCLSNSSSLLNGSYPTNSTPISPPALDDLKEGSSLSSDCLSQSSSLLDNGYLTHNTPISPPVLDDLKFTQTAPAASMVPQLGSSSSDRIVGRWIKERRDRKKEKAEAHKAQLHAAVSIIGAASSAAALAAAETEKITVSKQLLPNKRSSQTSTTAAMLVAAQCVEEAKAIDAADDHLASIIETASSVRNSEGIATLTATAATALKGAAHLKGNKASREKAEKAEKSDTSSHSENFFLCQHQVNCSTTSDWKCAELRYEENFLGICSREVLARGAQLLKRTRNGALHWKIVSVYMSKMGRVTLKMKSKHIAGTITKTKKNVIVDVCKKVQAWPRRFILDGEEQRCYFGLKTSDGRIIEFECKTEREHEIWTQGVTYLLNISREGRRAGPQATTS